MINRLLSALVALALCVPAFAQQVLINPVLQNARSTGNGLGLPIGTTLPASCSVGMTFFKTDAVAGRNIYQCAVANTWTAPVVGGTGSVTDVSVTTANGVSGSVATSTTTPAITLTLGAITPSSVNGLSLSGTGTTPAGIVLTNGTGLPVSTGISGLGTGVATFLATPSSANLAAAVTGETGTGALVFATSPTLVSPTLGAATATSINGNIFTTGTYTLTGVAGKTLTFNKSLTLEGTDSTTMTFPSTSATIARTDAANTFTGSQTLSGGTLTASTPVINASQTFNNSGVTFTGYNFSITDQAANAGSASGTLHTTWTGGTAGTSVLASLSKVGALVTASQIRANGELVVYGTLITNGVGQGSMDRETTTITRFISDGPSTGSGSRGTFKFAQADSTGANLITILTTDNAGAVSLIGSLTAPTFLSSPSIVTSTGNLSIAPASAITAVTGALTTTTTVKTGCVAVGSLPAAGSSGRRMCVTDQLTVCAAAGAALTGGGAVTCPAFDNGSAWVGG